VLGVGAEVVDVPADPGISSLLHALGAVTPNTTATARPILRSCILCPPC
jgi:hypothetical protein